MTSAPSQVTIGSRSSLQPAASVGPIALLPATAISSAVGTAPLAARIPCAARATTSGSLAVVAAPVRGALPAVAGCISTRRAATCCPGRSPSAPVARCRTCAEGCRSVASSGSSRRLVKALTGSATFARERGDRIAGAAALQGPASCALERPSFASRASEGGEAAEACIKLTAALNGC